MSATIGELVCGNCRQPTRACQCGTFGGEGADGMTLAVMLEQAGAVGYRDGYEQCRANTNAELAALREREASLHATLREQCIWHYKHDPEPWGVPPPSGQCTLCHRMWDQRLPEDHAPDCLAAPRGKV